MSTDTPQTGLRPDLDAVTVYTSIDKQPINKIGRRLPDGSVTKGMIEHKQHYLAEHRLIPDAAAMQAFQQELGERPDRMWSPSVYIDPPAERWETWPRKMLARQLGCSPDDRAKLAEWRRIDGKWVTARLKERMRLSSWVPFDRDPCADMPAYLKGLPMEDWMRAVDAPIPGFAACRKVWLPSTSSRILDLVKGEPLGKGSFHVLVQVVDPDDIAGPWHYAYERAAVLEFAALPWDDPVRLGFAKLKRSRATGEVCGRQFYTIYDQSTWHVNRLMFDGKPVVEGDGLTVTPAEVHMQDGPRLDFAAAAPRLSLQERRSIDAAIASLVGRPVRVERTRRVVTGGRKVVAGTTYVIDDLSMDLAVESEAGPTTVGAFDASGADHLRIQSPYRDSVSWAAYLGRHKDLSPFLYDSGTSEKHVLSDAAKLAAAKALLDRLRTEGADGPAFCTRPAITAAARLKTGEPESFTALKGHLRKLPTRVLSDWNPLVTAAAAVLDGGEQDDDDLLELVAEWFQDWRPAASCQDGAIICGDRKVKLAMVTPDSEIITALMAATGKTHQGAVNIFNALMKIVWGDLRRTLGEASRAADADDYFAVIENVLNTPLPYNLRGVERRYPLGSLALFHASLIGGERRRAGQWRRVPGLPVWVREDERGAWIAFWPTITAHLPKSFPVLDVSKTMLTRRCKAAGLSPEDNRITVDGGQSFAATIILPEKVAEMRFPRVEEIENALRDAPEDAVEAAKSATAVDAAELQGYLTPPSRVRGKGLR